MSNGLAAKYFFSFQTFILLFPFRGLRHIAVHCKKIGHVSFQYIFVVFLLTVTLVICNH
jgi:hypothetical protein